MFRPYGPDTAAPERRARTLGHGRVEGLRAIDDHQHGAQPAAGEIRQQPRQTVAFSVAP